ncbi:Arm DNA-binding domain-containing protein [Kordiimonas lipolytica]|uniref:Arm DNA-binding domain-containing protein n=1 Tax=Kordiimonas lipolytica TaxID=1662421 RepID=A0ABV8UD50_9PROT
MAAIGSRNGRLYIDFRYQGIRYKEYTGAQDTPANQRAAQQLLKRMEAEITLGTFSYLKYVKGGAKLGHRAA